MQDQILAELVTYFNRREFARAAGRRSGYGRAARAIAALEKALVPAQRSDGSWPATGVWGADGGEVYATSLAVLSLGIGVSAAATAWGCGVRHPIELAVAGLALMMAYATILLSNLMSNTAAANILVADPKVVAIVGALSSGVTLAVAESVTIPNNVILISPASTNPFPLVSVTDVIVLSIANAAE